MNLENISPKNLNEMEHHVRDLITTLQKAKFEDKVLMEALTTLGNQIGEMRRERFDAENSEYNTY
ncbi:MAG: hypothetical protein K8I82_11475 [Anaerolineae bacterium]|nr:hypothetical protein [Anaerolineae bacterium]